MRRIKWGMVLLLLSGCAAQPPQPQAPHDATALLLAEARQQATAGGRDQAIALVERALRMAPLDGRAWLARARLHFEAGELGPAEQFARRAQRYAGADEGLIREIEALLRRIREARSG